MRGKSVVVLVVVVVGVWRRRETIMFDARLCSRANFLKKVHGTKVKLNDVPSS